jgi:hypothetical protein
MTVFAVISIGVLLGIFMFCFAFARRHTALMSLLFEAGMSVLTEWWSGGWIPTSKQVAALFISLVCIPLHLLYGLQFS